MKQLVEMSQWRLVMKLVPMPIVRLVKLLLALQPMVKISGQQQPLAMELVKL